MDVTDSTTRSSTVVTTTLATVAALLASVTSVVGELAEFPVWKGATMMAPLEASDAGAPAGGWAVEAAVGVGLGVWVW